MYVYIYVIDCHMDILNLLQFFYCITHFNCFYCTHPKNRLKTTVENNFFLLCKSPCQECMAIHERKDANTYHDRSGVDSSGCAVPSNWTDSNRNCLSVSVGPRDRPQCCCGFKQLQSDGNHVTAVYLVVPFPPCIRTLTRSFMSWVNFIALEPLKPDHPPMFNLNKYTIVNEKMSSPFIIPEELLFFF